MLRRGAPRAIALSSSRPARDGPIVDRYPQPRGEKSLLYTRHAGSTARLTFRAYVVRILHCLGLMACRRGTDGRAVRHRLNWAEVILRRLPHYGLDRSPEVSLVKRPFAANRGDR